MPETGGACVSCLKRTRHQDWQWLPTAGESLSFQGLLVSDSTPASQHPSSRTAFLCVLAAGLVLRLFYFVGVSGRDDVDYYNYVLQVLDGTFSTSIVADGSFPFRFRIGLIYPTAAMFRVFGISEYTAAVLPLLSSLGLIWLCWAGGRRISESTGLLAALLMATFPLSIRLSTSLMPGSFAAFFSGLSIIWWLNTEDTERAQRAGSRGINIRYFCAGVCLGLGYFYRIEVGLFILFFIGFAAANRRAWRGCVLALTGAAAVVVVENLVYWGLHGELLYRLKAVSGGFAGLDKQLSEYVAEKKSVFVYAKAIFLKPTDLGLHWAAILPAAIWCVFSRRTNRLPILLWFWPVALYLFYGSWSLSSYVPTTKNPRYLINVSVPGIILLASLIDQLRQSGRVKKTLGNLSLAGIVVGSLLLANLVFAYMRENSSGSRIAAHYIRQQELEQGTSAAATGPVWTGHHSALALRCFLPHRDIRPVYKHDISFGLSRVDVQPEDIRTGIVVADGFVIKKYVRHTGMKPPAYLMNPPSDWKTIYQAPHPTDGFAFDVVRLISRAAGGRLSGPEQSLEATPVIIYEPQTSGN